jgi:hypothetical protein
MVELRLTTIPHSFQEQARKRRTSVCLLEA